MSENNTVSNEVALALSAALSKIETYVPTNYVDNSEPDIDAENLNHAEQAIMRVINLANAAVDVIQNLQSQLDTANSAISVLNAENQKLGKRFYGNKLSTTVTNRWTDMASLTLSPGTYIIEGVLDISSKGSGVTAKLASGSDEYGRQSVYAPDTNIYSLHLSIVVVVSATKTFTIQSWCANTFSANKISLFATQLR